MVFDPFVAPKFALHPHTVEAAVMPMSGFVIGVVVAFRSHYGSVFIFVNIGSPCPEGCPASAEYIVQATNTKLEPPAVSFFFAVVQILVCAAFKGDDVFDPLAVVRQAKRKIPSCQIVHEKFALDLDQAMPVFFIKHFARDNHEILFRPYPVASILYQM
nr:hypothetical protein DO63_2717 [Burkholderia pseudomallei]